MKAIAKRKLVLIGFSVVLAFCAVFLLVSHAPYAARADVSVSDFISTFTVSKGTKEVREGELRYTIGGERSYAEVLTDGYSLGSQWYVKYLTTRNVVMVHLKNDSPAESMKVYFKTKTKDWSEENSLSVPLYTDGEYHTYFIELTKNQNAGGELRGLRFAPQAAKGTIFVNHISFEREDTSYPYAGEVLSCTTDGYQVTVEGRLNDEYSGKTVTLYRTLIDNMDEEIENAEKLGTAVASGNRFTFSFPYHDGEVTMLSSHFIAAVGSVKVDRMFSIENWRDMTENPYAFELPERTVKASEYGAKGDAYTDDTAAIQSAIDAVSGQGGGTVVLEGDPDSEYGTRYVVTSIWMKDNVELRIEEGAVLWQSWREEDYTYKTYKGHDMEGIVWGHNGLAMNYPLVYSNQANNIKITGGGTLRLLDWGNQSRLNGYKPAYSEYCKSLIHLVPLGLYNSTNVEVSDIKILRTNCYHVVVYGCTNVYLGNLTLTEDNCLSGDGISIGVGSKNVVMDRCFLYTDDDAVVLLAQSISDPRGVTWWHAKPDGGDNRIRNITLRHSAITPGNVIVLITWGVDASDYTWQAMNGFYVYDNILGNWGESSTCMNLCPGQGYPYGEGGKSVPVNNFVVMNNSYRGPISNLNAMVKTNWIVDCDDVEVASDFVDASFSYKLGYWEYGGEYQQNVTVGGNTATLDFDKSFKEQYGAASLYQGLYLKAGTHTFSADITLHDASARLFVKEGLTGEIVAVKEVSSSGNAAVEFEAPREGVYLLGIDGGESASGKADVSSFAIASEGTDRPAWFEQDFEDGAAYFDTFGWQKGEEGGNSYLTFAEDTAAASLQIKGDYKQFDLKFDFKILKNDTARATDGNVFVRFGEREDAYYILRYCHKASRIQLESWHGGVSEIAASAEYRIEDGVWVQFGLSVGDVGVTVYADGAALWEAQPLPDGLGRSKITVGFTYFTPALDNVTLGEAGTLTFARSEHWSEKPVDPPIEPPEEPEKAGCGGTLSGGALVLSVSVLAAALVCTLQKKRGGRRG